VDRKQFVNAQNTGDAVEPNFTGRAASFTCGAVVRFSLHIDEAQRITDAKFRAAGCSVMVTAAALLAEQTLGKTTAEAASMAQQPSSLTGALNGIPMDRVECVALASEALLGAITQYSDSIRDTWEGDEALICTCFGVSERTIDAEIKERNLTTIDEVTRACNAGAGCRSCYPLIEELLASK
jgi:NifU-like protein